VKQSNDLEILPLSSAVYDVVRIINFFENSRVIRGVATGWTGVDMSTPLLPEVVPEIDANPVSFLLEKLGGVGGR